ARAAKDNSEPAIPRGHKPGGCFAMLGVMRAFRRHRADVDRLPSLRGNMRGNRLAKVDGGVVAGENNTFAV
ncbi:hypothetical protein RSW32_25200, partial [Escherichia coli]|nr:hypothetical protein [Escherichia coli]